MNKLMVLMDQSLEAQGSPDLVSELWDEVVAMRVKVGDCKKRLQVIPLACLNALYYFCKRNSYLILCQSFTKYWIHTNINILHIKPKGYTLNKTI